MDSTSSTARERGRMSGARPRDRRRLRPAIGIAVALGLLATFLGFAGGGFGAHAAVRKALINASTVSGSPSQEEQIATNLGFEVDVVTDAAWAAMTADQFGAYDLLIAGDPTCGTVPDGLVTSAPTYGPVVLGKAGGRTLAGNRIVVGTDPVFHDGGDFTSPGARGTIIREGIAYAASQPGATGMYFDPTCGDGNAGADTLAILNAISAGTGTWSINIAPPCGGAVSLIAANPAFTSLTTASLQGWGCSVHESFPTFTSDWSALAVATDTATTPTCGVDPSTSANACGQAYILVAGSAIVVESRVISISPLDNTSAPGGTHTVTANVHDQSGAPPVAGQLVDFTVTGQNAGATGTCAPADCRSDSAGNVTFTYSDANGAGDDTIKASFTDTAGALQTATAQQHWVGTGGGNVAPVANDVNATTPQDTPVAVTLSATDANSDPLTYAVVTPPAHGALSGTAPALTYTPEAGFSGTDTFTYTANDGTVDSNTATATITVTPVSTGCAPAPVVDATVSGDRTSRGKRFTAKGLTTTAPGDLVVAFIATDGPKSPNQRVTKVVGGDLTWTLAARSNETWGTAEIWQAVAPAPLTDAKVTATVAKDGYIGTITVTAFKGAAPALGAVGTGAGISTTPSATVGPTACNSLVWGTGHDWSRAKTPVPADGQTVAHFFQDKKIDDSFWVQTVDEPTADGASVTVSATWSGKDRWQMVAAEIPPAAPTT